MSIVPPTVTDATTIEAATPIANQRDGIEAAGMCQRIDGLRTATCPVSAESSAAAASSAGEGAAVSAGGAGCAGCAAAAITGSFQRRPALVAGLAADNGSVD